MYAPNTPCLTRVCIVAFNKAGSRNPKTPLIETDVRQTKSIILARNLAVISKWDNQINITSCLAPI